MVIGPGAEPTRAEAEDFAARWPEMLRSRLEWFASEVRPAQLDGFTESLVPLLRLVADRIGDERPVDPTPEWYNDVLRDAGWSAYGTALVEGLTAYLTELYRARLGAQVRWVLDTDVRSAHYLQPVFELEGAPPAWIQVRNALGRVQRGDPPDRLQSFAEATLAALKASESARGSVPEPWVEVTPDGRCQWQVSFPEDIAEQLGQAAYAKLEDRISAVDGVREAIMEDRDRAIVRTTKRVDQTGLTARLEAAVASLADED